MLKETLPAKPKEETKESQPEAKPIELSRKYESDKKVGRPKCGRNWKTGS